MTTALFVAALGVAALAMTVSAGAESGPSCADITGETHTYRGTGAGGAPPGPYSFAMELLLAAPACKQVAYTVYVIQDAPPGRRPTAVPQSGTSSLGSPQFLGHDQRRRSDDLRVRDHGEQGRPRPRPGAGRRAVSS